MERQTDRQKSLRRAFTSLITILLVPLLLPLYFITLVTSRASSQFQRLPLLLAILTRALFFPFYALGAILNRTISNDWIRAAIWILFCGYYMFFCYMEPDVFASVFNLCLLIALGSYSTMVFEDAVRILLHPIRLWQSLRRFFVSARSIFLQEL